MGKSRQIYQYIRSHHDVTKKDIMSDLDISLPTITKNLSYLLKLGLIDTNHKIGNTGGRNAVAYTYEKNARMAIGVSLTAHHISTVALNLSGDVIEKKSDHITFNLQDDSYLRKIGSDVEEVKQKAKISDEALLGVGISVPSFVSEDGEIVTYGLTLNFSGATRELIAKYVPYKNRLYHDSSAAGYAEVWVKTDMTDAFYISLGNSVGGAFIVNDVLYSGGTKKCGEVGHMSVDPIHGKRCYCGKIGCVDTVCRSSILDQYTDGNIGEFFRVLKEKDPKAEALWDEYLKWLAITVNNVHMLFDTTIIIGGYVGAYIDDYMDDLCSRVDKLDSFDDRACDYLRPCRYKIESVAAGAAIYTISNFYEKI